MIKKIAVIGGGTAGIIAATYIKKYWKTAIEVFLIYDHSNPGIGVGESLTPAIYKYLDFVEVTREELIKNVNATVKLGLKFKNWLNDGSYYYHNFSRYDDNFYNLVAAYDIAVDRYDNDTSYSSQYMEKGVIPLDSNAQQSLHIDATLFSKYIENKFSDQLTILDDVVDRVVVNNNSIDKLILKRTGDFAADFYIDATGFQSVLMKHLDSEWIDKTDWLPIDRCIPNPVNYEFKFQPPYTTSEATEDGWILQVPLSNRWGSGYLYSSNFLDDDLAFSKFDNWCLKNYNKTLTNKQKILKFKSGYWKDQWVGNCICVGLCSGFSEPLEATNIHHTVEQIDQFVHICTLEYTAYDINNYNKFMREFYENIYLYLRFCYSTDRTDSEFWKYITNTTPKEVSDLNEKVKHDFLTYYDLEGPMFSFGNFTRVAYGLKKCNKEKIYNALKYRGLLDHARRASEDIQNRKIQDLARTVDHKRYIDYIKTGK